MVIKPTYNKDVVGKMSLQQFRKTFGHLDFVKWFSDDDWDVEYERATGRKPVKKESDDIAATTRKSEKD